MGAVAHDRKAALDIGVEERVVSGEHGQRVRDLPLAVKVPSAEVHVGDVGLVVLRVATLARRPLPLGAVS